MTHARISSPTGSRLGVVLALGTILVLGFTAVSARYAPAAAQSAADSLKTPPPPPPPVATPPVPPLPPEVQMTDIIVIPSAADARTMKDASEAEEKALQLDVQACREREARYKTKVDIRKGEVQATKGRLELAKKEKNQPLQKELEATRNRQEAEVSLYERMMELERTKAELTDLRRLSSQSQRKAADVYIALQEKWKSRSEMLAMAAAAEKLVQAERQVREAEKKGLEAMKDAASRKSDVMGKEKDLVDRRLAAFQALTKVLAL